MKKNFFLNFCVTTLLTHINFFFESLVGDDVTMKKKIFNLFEILSLVGHGMVT